jgi:hypothetical protein
MAAVFRALQFDDDEVGITINPENAHSGVIRSGIPI